MTKKIRLIILGTGGMAKAHATAFQEDPRCEIVATVDVMPGALPNLPSSSKSRIILKIWTRPLPGASLMRPPT